MKLNKAFTILLASTLLIGTSALAQKPEWAGKGKDKVKKEKSIPYGLQKKVQRGGQLPPGWQKKIAKGEVLDQDILNRGRVIKTDEYSDIRGTKIYEIQDKIVRISNATKIILDVLK